MTHSLYQYIVFEHTLLQCQPKYWLQTHCAVYSVLKRPHMRFSLPFDHLMTDNKWIGRQLVVHVIYVQCDLYMGFPPPLCPLLAVPWTKSSTGWQLIMHDSRKRFLVALHRYNKICGAWCEWGCYSYMVLLSNRNRLCYLYECVRENALVSTWNQRVVSFMFIVFCVRTHDEGITIIYPQLFFVLFVLLVMHWQLTWYLWNANLKVPVTEPTQLHLLTVIVIDYEWL